MFTPPRLSVIISTSPGRQQHLFYCLKALQAQQDIHCEVIISDDGSEGMVEVISQFKTAFPLVYLPRPHDGNLSRSRNMGAAQARTPYLVFINTDVLLNPHALQAYYTQLTNHPQATLWGYVGCRKSSLAPSLWFPELSVNWLDFRFFPLGPHRWFINPDVQQAPYRLAGGHHFAMTRQVFEHVGGFHLAFQQWGDEDVEFALRSLLAGHPMCFLTDVWAEHMPHGYQEVFHLQADAQQLFKSKQIIPLEIEWENRFAPEQRAAQVQMYRGFWPVLENHYLRHDSLHWQQEQRLPHLKIEE